MNRVQKKEILRDLEKKMVFLVGPRQAGKTWLAKNIAKEFPKSVYLNYDQITDREIINAQSWPLNTDLLVLDELHKKKDWKNFIKGVFDTKPDTMRILVTGSARLDIYDQIGDSLPGRYFRHRLLPLSAAELTRLKEPVDIDRLLERGGFPEPYLAANEMEAKRWRTQYFTSILTTDIFEIEKIHNISTMRLIFEMLQTRVGSPVSYQSIAEDLKVSPTTVKKYIEILEALFVVFRVTPYSKNIARSVEKEPKIYFYDVGMVKGEGARLENLVAVSLLKHVYGKVDYEGKDYKLHYLRTRDGIEVDFAVVYEDKVVVMTEVKLSDGTPTKALLQFHEKYGFPSVQVVKNTRHSYRTKTVGIEKAESFLADLFL